LSDTEEVETSGRPKKKAKATGPPGQPEIPRVEPFALMDAAAKDGTGRKAGPVDSDEKARALLKQMRQHQDMRAKEELAQAEILKEKAKEMARHARSERRVRVELGRIAERVAELAPQLGLDPNRAVTIIPPLSSAYEQVEFITIQPDRSYIRISFDKKTNRYLYESIEPELTTTEREIFEFLSDTLVRTLDARGGREPDQAREFLMHAVDEAIVDHTILIDNVSRERILYYLLRDFLGYGPVDVLMQDPLIEDISCDGPNIPIYVFHRQYESLRSNVAFTNDHALDSFVIRLAQRCGKHISIAEPLLDATLPDTSRLQASLSREVTTRGSTFTIRKFRADPLTPPDLIRMGTIDARIAAYYWLAMEEGNSIIYAGGTASGKTTTLNAVAQFIPPDKKVVSIEDTREIHLTHENWIASLTRTGFWGGDVVGGKMAGTIDMYRLLEAALRQRPEYLLVGEVRGPEALTLFQAMATGHATYSTLHADSAQSAVYRLENPPINVPRVMLETLDVISIQIQSRVKNRLVRRVKDIVELEGVDPRSGDLLTNTVFEWDPAKDTFTYHGKSRVLDRMAHRRNEKLSDIEREWEDRTMLLQWMTDHGIRHIKDVAPIISEYYRMPEALKRRVRDQKQVQARHGG